MASCEAHHLCRCARIKRLVSLREVIVCARAGSGGPGTYPPVPYAALERLGWKKRFGLQENLILVNGP